MSDADLKRYAGVIDQLGMANALVAEFAREQFGFAGPVLKIRM